VGMKPSYGMVSRYGLVDMAMSFDQIGPLASRVEDCEVVFDVIKGKDDNDAVSRDFGKVAGVGKEIKIGVLNVNADKRIWELITERIKSVKGDKWKVTSFNMGHVDLGIQTYYPIVYVEFFSGTRKFDGRKYGLDINDVGGNEVLRRIYGGGEISKAEFAGKYYRRALKAKKIIEREFEGAFKKFDFIILPTVPKLPHKVGSRLSLEDEYDYDTLTVLANLAEIPAISVPVGTVLEKGENIPVGLQILGAKGRDSELLGFAKGFEGGK
jgi:aspartyl-tRNA(Asn)/glutamyl-tRNA(Gln) amidotransferase subunit A